MKLSAPRTMNMLIPKYVISGSTTVERINMLLVVQPLARKYSQYTPLTAVANEVH